MSIQKLIVLAALLWLTGWPMLLHAEIIRISVAENGSESNADSYQARLSDNGSIVVYRSNADNLVANDTNDWPDIFLRDVTAGSSERISLAPGGSQLTSYSKAPSISSDGQWIVYEGRLGGITSVLVYDRINGITLNPLPDTFSGNPVTPSTARVGPAIAGNGSVFAFQTNSALQNAFPASIRPVNDDTDTAPDIFIYDLVTSPTPPVQRISRQSNSNSLDADNRNPSIDETGQFIAFESFSDLLPEDDNNQGDILLKDRLNGPLQLISATPAGASGNAVSLEPAISDNGNFVAFRSGASNLVPEDTNARLDIFVRNVSAGTTERVSVASDSSQANQNSFEPDISGDGRFVVFRSNASNLVAGDTNARTDIFVHDRSTGETARVGQPAGEDSNGNSVNPAISGDGQWIVFESEATNLVAGDTNGARDIFRAPNPLFNTRTTSPGGSHE